MFKFQRTYFLIFIIILLIEIFIALYIKDRFIRPYFGDVLVVILIYCFLKSFLLISNIRAIIIVFIFSFGIEICQAFHLIELLNLEKYTIAHWVLGSSFNAYDFLAYTVGLGIVLISENLSLKLLKK